MRRKLLEILCALSLCLVQATHAQTQRISKKPSLDALRERAEAYWSLLAKHQKVEAASFVERASRENFVARQEPDFSEPHLNKIEFTTNSQEAVVTFVIKRVLQPIQQPFHWSVQEKWVYSDGVWYVEIPKPSAILGITKASGSAPAPSTEALEKKREDLRKRLEFHSTSLTFGTVRKGATAVVPVEYAFRGTTPLQFSLQNPPVNLSILGAVEDKTAAGSSMLRLALRTGNMDGEVNLGFVLLAREGDTEVPYELKMHGFVYSPVYFFPATLRFAKGELEKDLEVKNNSKMEVRLASFLSQSDAVRIKDLPRSLMPGEKCTLKIVLTSQAALANTTEEIDIKLQEPVEGLAGLRIFVMRNYVPQTEPPKPKIPSRNAVEELMRKVRPEQRINP